MTTARTKIAAAALGAAFAFTSVGPAAAAPVYPPPYEAVECNLKPIQDRTKLKLNVNPNLPGNDNYRFRLYKKVNGVWIVKKKLATRGEFETRTMNQRRGKYKAKCYGRAHGYLNAYSSVVWLRK